MGNAYTMFVWIVTVFVAMTTHQVYGINLTILHTNDFHSRIMEINKFNESCSETESNHGECYGGVERLKTKIEEMININFNSYIMLLDTGNQYQGSLFYQVHGGGMLADFMNTLKYDAMSLGVHEFDTGHDGLEEFVRNASFKIVSSNTDFSKSPDWTSVVTKSDVVLVRREKVGVVGYVDSNTLKLSNPGEITFSDEIEAIQKEVDKLTKQGINKIIALGCAEHERHLEIAKEVKGIDVIVGGGSKTFLYNGDKPAEEIPEGPYPTVVENKHEEKVLVVTAGAYGKYLGNLRVTYNDNGKVEAWKGNPILLGPNVYKDPSMKQQIDDYATEVKRVSSQQIGKTMVHLDGNQSVCSFQECNMGNMITDMMVSYYVGTTTPDQPWNNAIIAITNANGMKISIPRGDVDLGQILKVLPFSNTYDMAQLTGKVIIEALEHSASAVGVPSPKLGVFLQVSGLRVVYDLRKAVGKRVVMVHSLCTKCSTLVFEPLNLTKTYNVILPSFLVHGGLWYTMLEENIGSSRVIGPVDKDAMKIFIEKFSPISAGVEGRIRFLEDIENSDLCTASGVDISSSPLFLILITNVIFIMVCFYF